VATEPLWPVDPQRMFDEEGLAPLPSPAQNVILAFRALLGSIEIAQASNLPNLQEIVITVGKVVIGRRAGFLDRFSKNEMELLNILTKGGTFDIIPREEEGTEAGFFDLWPRPPGSPVYRGADRSEPGRVKLRVPGIAESEADMSESDLELVESITALLEEMNEAAATSQAISQQTRARSAEARNRAESVRMAYRAVAQSALETRQQAEEGIARTSQLMVSSEEIMRSAEEVLARSRQLRP
jgi:hypothetical protein